MGLIVGCLRRDSGGCEDDSLIVWIGKRSIGSGRVRWYPIRASAVNAPAARRVLSVRAINSPWNIKSV